LADDLRPPRLVSHWFGDNPQFARLARVLEFTARRHCPGWSIEVERVNPAPRVSPLGVPSHAHNTMKMDTWAGVIAAAEHGDRVLLIDSDTAILRPLDDVWDQDFDMAYTVKETTRFPFNSGVVFLRVNESVRVFAEEWQRENARLLNDPREHQVWRSQFGGVNQAALGYMLTSGIVEQLGLRLVKLPCVEWNNEDTSWQSFDPARTRIIHIKSGLRRAVFGFGPVMARLRPLVRVWRELERVAGGGPAPVAPPPPRPRPVVSRTRPARFRRVGA
jgi:hypothetical protein